MKSLRKADIPLMMKLLIMLVISLLFGLLNSCAQRDTRSPTAESSKNTRSLSLPTNFGCAHNSQSLCIEYPGFQFSEQDVRQICSHSKVETFLKEGCPLTQRAHSCDLRQGIKLHVYSSYRGKWREICGIVRRKGQQKTVALQSP